MDGAPQPCHYHRLGVSSDATVDEIRSAFRNRALQIHPDKQANSGISPAVATAAFQELNHAYEVLLRFHLSEVDVSQPKQQSSSRYSFHEQNSSACSAYWELGGCSQSSGNEVSTKHARPCYDIGKGVEFTKTRDFAWVEDHDAWPDWKVREFMDDAVMGKMMMKLEKKQKNSSVRDAHKRKKKREVRGMKCQKKDKRTQRVERAAYRMSLKDQKDEKRRFDRSRICYEKPEWMEEEEEEEIASLSQQWMKRNKWKKHKVKVGELMDALEDEDDGEGRVLFQFNCEMPPEEDEDEDEDEDEEGIDELCEQTNFDDPYFNKDLSDDDEEDVDAGIEGDKVIERSNKKVIGIVLRRRVKIMRRLN